MRTINYLINVYSITFWGLYHWLVHSFFVFFARVIDYACGCFSFELVMMKVMPYDPSHEEVYNAFITETEPKTVVFSAKPTETDRQETFWNRNNTIHYYATITFPTKFITCKDLDSLFHSFPSCPVVVCGGLRFSDLPTICMALHDDIQSSRVKNGLNSAHLDRLILFEVTFFWKVDVLLGDSQRFRSWAISLTGANRPIEPWPIRSLELSLPGLFAPWPTHSLEPSLLGPFAPCPSRIGHAVANIKVGYSCVI